VKPIDLSTLTGAIAWPLVVVCALIVFRGVLVDLVRIVSRRVNKLSIGGFEIELAKLPDLTPPSLEIELRSLAAAPQMESGSLAISNMFLELQSGEPRGYILIDIGSKASPRWLNSRLYLFTFLIMLLERLPPIVFVCTSGDVRHRFIGVATPDRVRWALAFRYPYLESAMAKAYAELEMASKPWVAGVPPDLRPSGFQFDPNAKSLTASQAQDLIRRFLIEIQRIPPPPGPPAKGSVDWIVLRDGTAEYARWLNAERIERLLRADLGRACVVLQHNQIIDDLEPAAVLKRQVRYVAVLDAERAFLSLLDRYSTLEQLALNYVKQARSNATQATTN
jgi:hypothetical protein